MTLHRLALLLAALAALVFVAAAGSSDTRRAPRAAAAAATAGPSHDRLVFALLEPERIVSVDLRTGATTTLQLTAGTLCRGRLLVVDGRIVYLDPGLHGSRVMSVDLALRERPHWLANADAVLPSPVPGDVWIATRAPRLHGHWLVQRLTVRGGAIARPPRRAPSRPIVGAMSEGLVLQGGRGTFVWDPGTGRRGRGTPGAWVLAAHGSLIASCGGRCRTLLLADGHGGRVVHAPPGARFLPAGAALSPTGDLLALTLAPARAPRLALVDTATGARRLLPGAALGQRPAVAFSPDGARLYVVDRLDRVRVFARDGTLGAVLPRVGAPVVQLLAAPAPPQPAPVPRFGWLPPGWRQVAEAPLLPGVPAGGSVLATSWPYRPTPHGPAGALPPGGLLVSVQLLRRPRGGPPSTEPLAPLTLPERPTGALEGRPDVPEYRVFAVCGARRVEVRVDVAARRLSRARRAQVQRMLDALVLPPPPSGCLRTP